VKKRACIPVIALAAVSAAMFFVPPVDTVAVDAPAVSIAEVKEVDNSLVDRIGMLEYGTQRLVVELPDGRRCAAVNELRAQLDTDKKFRVGDSGVVVPGKEPVTARDHYRLGGMTAFFAFFAALLVIFGGWTGAKALFSFVFCCLAVWKILVPLTLNGFGVSWTVFVTVSLLTAVIMYLVAGATRMAFSAFLGSMLGTGVSLLMAHLCTWLMNINGATMPFAQALLYAGYESLDLADIFAGAVILASSGAVMDLAMDIAAGVAEVHRHNPGLSARRLFGSGLAIGRAVVGTMTTTLLLAYSGGYLTLLMVFAAQGTSPSAFMNSTIVSAEMVKTLVGSFGLVTVAPFTALVSSLMMRGGKDGK
jgi:uncharacterized membrane protein